MMKIELKLEEDVLYAGDEISLQVSLIKELALKNLQLLDGSIQLIGRSIFVSDFYNFARVQELFGDLSKVKEECKVMTTEKGGGTFTIPFYISKASLLTLSNETDVINWKGRIPKHLPPSLIGLFCSFQHVAQVKITWKCLETGQIGVSQSEISFKILAHPISFASKFILGILEDFKWTNKAKEFDEIFPDTLVIENEFDFNLLQERVKRVKLMTEESSEDVEEVIRSVIESDFGFNRSISIEPLAPLVPSNDTDNNIYKIATIHLKRTLILPGTQIFIKIDLNLIDQIDFIKIKLECLETYPQSIIESGCLVEWRDIVKEIKIVLGCQDQIEIVFPVPPELPPSISCELFSLQWELSVNFTLKQQDFDMKIPLKFISFKQLSTFTSSQPSKQYMTSKQYVTSKQ